MPKFDFELFDQQIKRHAERGRNCFERRCGTALLAGLDVGNEALPETGSLAELVLRQSAPFADGADGVPRPRTVRFTLEIFRSLRSPDGVTLKALILR